jgi:hypothetical protein
MSANDDRARSLLSRIPALQRPCDLDVLVFFARHPRTLLYGEQLARLLGYDVSDIAQSLSLLMAADLLSGKAHKSRTVQLYVFAGNGANGDCLAACVELASSREGRLALRRALTRSTHNSWMDGPRKGNP